MWYEKKTKKCYITLGLTFFYFLKDFEDCELPCLMDGEQYPIGWTEKKFIHIMNSRQKALNLSRYLAFYQFSSIF